MPEKSGAFLILALIEVIVNLWINCGNYKGLIPKRGKVKLVKLGRN